MKFGLFGAATAQRSNNPDVDSAAGFRDYIDYVIEAESLGYESVFIVEHHFTGFGQVSATLNLLTWIGAKTPTIQRPHPPFWQGAGHPESIRRVAARGHNLLLDQFASINETIRRFNIYRDAMLASGLGFNPHQVGGARAFFVADSQ